MSMLSTLRTMAARHVVLPINRILRPEVGKCFEMLPRAQAWYRMRPEEARQHQIDLLRSLLVEAQAHVPYYRELFRQSGFSPESLQDVADISRLPPLARLAVQTRCRDLCTDRADLPLRPNASGGSSGSPVIIYMTDEGSRLRQAATTASDIIAGYTPGCAFAVLWGAPSETSAARSHLRRLLNWVRNYELFDAFDMDEERMACYHRRLSRFKPDILLCYAASLHLFARYLTAEGLKPAYPRKGLITSAETLTPSMRRDIEAVFGQPVFNRYGSRETGIIAMECERHAGLHVMGLNVLVEVVDADTLQPVRDRPGEVLVTTLHNYGMPLIRYRLGDAAVLSDEPCPCGRPGPIIREVLGRTSEVLRLSSGRVIHGEYFTHLLYGIAGVLEFRFIQETLHIYRLLLVTEGAYNVSHDRRLAEEIRQVVGSDATVTVEHLDRLEPLPSGKRQFIVSQLAADRRVGPAA
jgi:phenylacetate-CoA ligase